MAPSKRPANRGRRAQPFTFSAPTGGLNGRDSLTEMPQTDAFVLDNWYPNGTCLETRGGSLNFVTGFPSDVESLEAYTGAAGNKLFGFSDGGIYDITNGGALPSPTNTGRTSNQTTSTMFSNTGAQWLLVFTGADPPLGYDGSWSALTITGLNSGKSQNNLFGPCSFKGRVYLCSVSELGFYFLAVSAIQGAASYFDLSQQCLSGGQLVGIGTYSQDSQGTGPNDYMVFMTDQGEYVMYAGYDPSDAANWELVGRYYGPPPIGKKGFFRFRSDLYIITEEGILSFTQIRQMGTENSELEYITSKLGKLYTDQSQYQSTYGWCGLIYPGGQALVVNQPQDSATTGDYYQFVMNTNTNSWCRYTGLDGICWQLFKGTMYFGTSDGRVVEFDTGFTDNGTEVVGECRQAWNTFDDENNIGNEDKQYHFAAFAIKTDGSPYLSADISVNYEDDEPTFPAAFALPPGAEWDIADWDVSNWAGAPVTQNVTIPIGKIGYIASVWVKAISLSSTVQWFATRVIYENLKSVILS